MTTAFIRSQSLLTLWRACRFSPLVLALAGLSAGLSTRAADAEFQAGAAVVDVTPPKLPVLVNGGMLSRSLDKVKTPVNARALVLADDQTKLAIVVVDSCMMPRPLLDEAKALTARLVGIPADRILVSATHTHSAPSSMGALGTEPDLSYVPFLIEKIAEAVASADKNLQAAQVGFGSVQVPELTALRRWIRRPDRIATDPFGNATVRANMHAAGNLDDVTGESGPEDPVLGLISIQSRTGEPIAVLANFSMHYFSDSDISADYYGLFCAGLKERIAPKSNFVGIMSHGCSGDIWRRDYAQPDSWDPKLTIEEYSHRMVDAALQAYAQVKYRTDVDLAMAERRMTLKYRTPDLQRVEWARRIVEAMGDRPPKDTTEVYAREQLLLHEKQQTEVVVQALRIGEIGIATTPNETYAITGLKVKAASPLTHNLVIELANGGDGYIPPVEQHGFGGYNTWAARSAGLEVQAEAKIAETCIGLLERVAGRPRQERAQPLGPAAQTIRDLKPVVWWRLDEFSGPRAIDSSGHAHDGHFEAGVTYYLEGPLSKQFSATETNRAAMFVGGRVSARLPAPNSRYTVSLWAWNGLPAQAREVTGWLFSRGPNHGLGAWSDHLGVGGLNSHEGLLVFQHGDDPAARVSGKTQVPRWEWQHVALVRDGQTVRAYLNGELELSTDSAGETAVSERQVYVGGRSDGDSGWEGRLDEVAVFDRALTPEEIRNLATPR